MKKVILLLIILFSTIMADSVLLVKKGWQLIGSSTTITDMSMFDSKNVEQIWHFDATTQKWLGYSPDSSIQNKIREHNISKLTSLKNWHGFWIKSKREWTLVLPDSPLNSVPNDENNSHDIIELKEGWNLISLPINSVVSPDIFKGMTVWKYNPNDEWELFDNSNEEEFPPIRYINNSDALWVKANQDINISVAQESAKLHNFSSKEAMESYIKDMIIANNRPFNGIIRPLYMGIDIAYSDESQLALPTATREASSTNSEETTTTDATQTNIQENGVDESDILKHDNNHIFYVVNGQNSHINITSFEELTNNNNILAQISFDDYRVIDSIYLINNRLVVLSYSRRDIDSSYFDRNQLILVDIYNVSDINSIQKIKSYKIDGTMVTSRVIGDELYLISNFTPYVNITYPKVYVELSNSCKEYFENSDNYYDDDEYSRRYAECFNIYRDDQTDRYYRYNYDNPTIEVRHLTPQISSDNISQELIEPSKLYAPSKQNQSTTITTISSISISDGEYKNSNSFIGDSSVQYASSKALYLVSNQYPIYYDFYNYKEQSKIYKFDLNRELEYKGLGSVYGHTLNQFSLSEYNNILRVATTQGFSWESDGTQNSIYTLKSENQKLQIEGILSGFGKEGESIKSVRFIKDKAFVVTFRQTDPFYTIDISNPQQPKKVGELQVNGYSAYLHPVGDDKILGIGRDATPDGRVQGLKLELFDISDLANPTSLDTISYSSSTTSQLEYNHKALAYRSSDNLFAFPYSVNGDYTTDYRVYNYLGIYQIKDNKIQTYPAINSTNRDWSQSRGLIFDLNNKTYVSFFNNSNIVTQELNITE